MSAAVWCLIETVSEHESTEVTVIVIPVKELLLIRCMEYIFDLTGFIPLAEERKDPGGYRHFSDAGFRLGGDDVKVLFIQMDVLFL